MGFFTGIQLYGKAFGILFSRKFWWFMLFPVVILLLLFLGGNWLVNYAGEGLYGLVEEQIRTWVEGISWLQWIGQATGIFIRVILKQAVKDSEWEWTIVMNRSGILPI